MALWHTLLHYFVECAADTFFSKTDCYLVMLREELDASFFDSRSGCISHVVVSEKRGTCIRPSTSDC